MKSPDHNRLESWAVGWRWSSPGRKRLKCYSTATEVLYQTATYNYLGVPIKIPQWIWGLVFLWSHFLWGFFTHICCLGFPQSQQGGVTFPSRQITALRCVCKWWCACFDWMLFKRGGPLKAVNHHRHLGFCERLSLYRDKIIRRWAFTRCKL